MKTVKFIFQILGCLLYAGLLLFLLSWIFGWIFELATHLSVFWFTVMVLVGFGAFFRGRLTQFLGYLSVPFIFMNKNNVVATILSVLSSVVLVVMLLIDTWTFYGAMEVPFVEIGTRVFITSLALNIGFVMVFTQISAYANE